MGTLTTERPPAARRLPGVDGFWICIGSDAMFFALLFASFMHDRSEDPARFEASRLALNADMGGIDTLILLTSSWLVALAIQAIKRDQAHRVAPYLLGGALTGAMFVVSKAIEYSEKFAAGITPATDTFYMWYFTLTGIHLGHVLLGTSLLTYLWVKARRGAYSASRRTFPECVATYWHLVDLLWIVLFPLLYLQKAV